jgi:serine/threonine protein phosphatase 1
MVMANISTVDGIEIQTSPWHEAPAALTGGKVLFAIGDVHGHDGHLRALHDFIRARIEQAYDPKDVCVVWLGDYVDRGPRPRECLDLVREGLAVAGVREVALKGNHEQFLLEVVDDPSPKESRILVWEMNGGGQTIAGLLPERNWRSPKGLSQGLRRSLGNDRLNFLHHLALTHRVGPYLCAHAGINPDRGLDDQRVEDLLWIREPFLHPLSWTSDVVVIHGHTPQAPAAHRHRIGIDSGVFFTGRLTAVELQADRMRFIGAENEAAKFFDWSFIT